jgi:IS5 family transposase
MSRTAERQVSFADWELMRQGLRLEPLLQAISDFLDNQKDMIEQVRCDLTRGLKNAETGRNGMTPQQILRSLVLMRIKNWDYRELRERIADGCTCASSQTSIVGQCHGTMHSTAASPG